VAEGYIRVRSDLEIRPESEDPTSPVIVKDPVARRFYRFTAVQAAVLEGLDGMVDATSLAAAVSGRFGTAVTESQIGDFVLKLRNLLLLDEQPCWLELEKLRKRNKRLLSTVLSYKVYAFDPDRLLTYLERKLRFCFRLGFNVIAAVSISLAVVISLLHWQSLFYSLGELFSLYTVPLVVMVAFAVMTIHEFGHGLTLKHFRGKVEEMGFMFLYFIPAFYCNVSDAWLLKKRERILVTLAGGYIQVVIWAWAIIAWRLLAPETFMSRACLVVIGFAAIQSLFNFNPLIRLDGYYLLSDYLEIPNLRSKAFAHLKRRIGAGLFGRWRYAHRALPPRPHERVFLAYGSAAVLFSAALIWIMLDQIGGWLLREYQTWGLVLLSALILMAIPAVNREAVPRNHNLVGGILVKFKKLPYFLLFASAILASGFLPWELKIAGDFTILPHAEVSVTPQCDGTLKDIRVTEGDPVNRGAVLAELQNLDLNNNYEETKGELASRRASLDLLRAGTRPEEIERARRTIETKRTELSTALRVDQERAVLQDKVARKQAELANAQKNYERSQSLLAAGLIARNEAERDQTLYEVRQKELAEAQGELKVLQERIDRTVQIKQRELDQARSELTILQAGSRKEQIRAMEAEVAKLEQKIRILEQQLQHLYIRSPIQGVVATPYLNNRIGEYIRKGDPFCRIVSMEAVRIDMPVPEKEIADVKPEYPIILKVRGYPRRSFEAHVRSISPVAMEDGSVRKIVVQGDIQNSEGLLKPGMTGVGKILCGKRTIAELLSRRAVRWIRTEFWQYLP